MAMHLRKLILLMEETHAVARSQVSPAARKVLAAAVVRNPLAGSEATDDDLGALVALGGEVGALLGTRGAEALGAPVLAYGKAVIVGTAGQLEHGAAVLHPKFGGAVRAAIGHGVDIMPSTKKVASAGAGIDVPIHQKDNGAHSRGAAPAAEPPLRVPLDETGRPAHAHVRVPRSLLTPGRPRSAHAQSGTFRTWTVSPSRAPVTRRSRTR